MSRGTDFLGPYRLVKLIRAGQTAQVWEAIKDPEPDRIAVKVLLQEFAADKTAVESLKHEAEVGKLLDDKHVIRIYEFNGSFGRPFIAMQLFKAPNIKQLGREDPAFLAYHATEILQRCAKGISYLHSQGWIHCDIKPDNFLVNEEVAVKLIDFSIAQKIKKQSGLAALFSKRNKTIRGTRSYMSPEQIRGQQMDERSDIYSFGCMAYEMLAGKPPFSGANGDELLMRHLRAAAPNIQAQNNAITPEMSELLINMMQKEPDKRPSTMTQFLEHFQTIRVYRAGMRPPAPAEVADQDA